MTQSEAQRATPRREVNVQGHASKEPKMKLRWSKRRLGNEAQRVRKSQTEATENKGKVEGLCGLFSIAAWSMPGVALGRRNLVILEELTC